MKIYLDVLGNIKAINKTYDFTLQEIEVNREEVFEGFTDIEILNFRYTLYLIGFKIEPQEGYRERIIAIQGTTDK